jgi:hypothetical protein
MDHLMERQMPDYHRIPFQREFLACLLPLLAFSAYLAYRLVTL